MKKILFLISVALLPLSARIITLPGTVVSNGQKMIGSRYMGYVKKVYVKLGDRVKREDDLYEMESAEFDIMKSQADLMLEQAQVMVEFWRKRLNILNEKRKRLEKKGINNGIGDLDDLEAQAENIKSMLEAAKIGVKEAAIKAKQMATIYNYLKMKAPSDGVVVVKNIKPGDMVMPGMLTIMIVDTEDLDINVAIAESTLNYVREGDQVIVEIPALHYRTDGIIHAIIPSANPMTHKINMRVTFDRGDANVIPGMYAKVIVHTDKR